MTYVSLIQHLFEKLNPEELAMTWKDYKKSYLWYGSSFVDSREFRYAWSNKEYYNFASK